MCKPCWIRNPCLWSISWWLAQGLNERCWAPKFLQILQLKIRCKCSDLWSKPEKDRLFAWGILAKTLNANSKDDSYKEGDIHLLNHSFWREVSSPVGRLAFVWLHEILGAASFSTYDDVRYFFVGDITKVLYFEFEKESPFVVQVGEVSWCA